MGKNFIILVVILLIFLAGSVSASPAVKIVGGVVTKVVSTVFKRLWSLKSPSRSGAIPSRSMVKFESGYTVETVFDGSKHGIEPYSVEISTVGEIFILDSHNSNIYEISSPLSRYSRPKLLAGSVEGYTGHVDGKLRQARMNRPKGLAVDNSGNIYIADTSNMAIRKISDSGVVTIAGGKSGRGGHVDGPSEDAKFSDDFDLVYVGSSCSLLVIDRGNQAIREIPLHEDDCSHQDDGNLHLGIAVLAAACFFGYMLALLQRRISAMLSYSNEPKAYAKGMQPATYQRPPTKSLYPPLIPPEDEYEKQEDGFFTSLGRLFANTGSSIVDIFITRKPVHNHHMQQSRHHHHHYPSRAWPVQESFVIPREDGPPPIETREPTPTRRSHHPITTKDVGKTRQFKQNRPYYNEWDEDYNQQSQQRHMAQLQHHQHHQKHRPTSPSTNYYEPQSAETDEIVFGAVQEQDGCPGTIKAVDYDEPVYSNQNNNVRSRYNNYMSYNNSYGY